MRNNRGLTLVELMVVIGIIAVVSAIAVPNLIGWRGKRQLEAAVNEVQTAINVAKTTAVKRGTPATILLTTPAHGITVFTDNNNPNGSIGTIDSGDLVAAHHVLCRLRQPQRASDSTCLSFDRRGFTNAVSITLASTQNPRKRGSR